MGCPAGIGQWVGGDKLHNAFGYRSLVERISRGLDTGSSALVLLLLLGSSHVLESLGEIEIPKYFPN